MAFSSPHTTHPVVFSAGEGGGCRGTALKDLVSRTKPRVALAEECWEAKAPPRELALKWSKPARQNRLPRRLLHDVLAKRTGHGSFRSYHQRFGHADSTWERCYCGEWKKRGHLAEYPLTT